MENLSRVNWEEVLRSLDARGFAQVQSVLSPDLCDVLIRLYNRSELFRSTIDMQRYRFGRGEYKYFRYPLPRQVEQLREQIYPRLAPLANEWMQRMGAQLEYPQGLQEFMSVCHDKDQRRPTPLVLRYEAGGYNSLHQDVYGDVFFPFQVVFMLTEAGKDYEGGELVFVEQLPRAQSRAEVLSPARGDAVIFTTNFRPVKGVKGYYRTRMKHGVSTVKTGVRYSMGLIFHDAD